MDKNEERLNNLVDELNYELKQLKSSDQYKIGCKIFNNRILNRLLRIVKKIKDKKIPEDKLDYSYKQENYSYDGLDDKRIAVYKCITGGYDEIRPPKYKNNNIDYILLTNNKKVKTNDWKVIHIDNVEGLNDAMLNRYVRMHPSKFLSGYDYAIYVDGNMIIYSDPSCLVNRINPKYGFALSMHSTRMKLSSEYLACKKLKKGNSAKMKKQIEQYKEDGYPDDYGLLETTVIAIDLKSKAARDILEQWWDEFYKTGSMRDQVSLPYVLWKNKIDITAVGTLGNNIWLNPKFERIDHVKK